MAATSLFKQQCPHCEKSIPIKDEKLIGEEIKCPKCKSPFVVEDPADATNVKAKKMKTIDDSAAEEGGAETGISAKRGLKSPKMMLGIGLAVAALVFLGVAMIFLLGGNKSADTKKLQIARTVVPQPAGDAEQAPKAPTKAEKTVEEPQAQVSAGNPSNMLPNDSEIVINVQVQEMLHTPLGREVLIPPSNGAGPIERHYGFNVEDVDRWIITGSYSQDWLFHVVRTKKPIASQPVKKALHLKPAEAPIEGQDYFVTAGNWLEGGSPFRMPEKGTDSIPAATPGSRPMAMRFADAQTLVFGDLAPVQEFLKAKGHPRAKSTSTSKRRRGEGDEGKDNAAPVVAANYASLSPRLRSMLEQAETKPPVVFSYAVDFENLGKAGPPWDKLPARDEMDSISIGLHMKDNIFLNTAMEGKDEQQARAGIRAISQAIHALEPMASRLGVKLQISEKLPPEEGRGGRQPARRPNADDEDDSGGGGGGGGGGRSMGRVQGGSGGGPPAAPPQAPPPPKGGELPIVTVSLNLDVDKVILSVSIPTDQKLYDEIVTAIRPFLARPVSEMEMMAAHPEAHPLAVAIHQYADEHRQFPQGAARRLPSPARANRPWPPDARVSWMADMLPYLGYDSVYAQVHPQKSWQDHDNVAASVTIIPAFIAPDSPRSTWYVQYPGMRYEVATTHYVGIAGVGLDAAEYSASNAEQAKRMGVFGYERVTRVADILDGLSNTILVAQVPPTYKAPWIAGGGSTVRGVPEKNSIQPFVSTTYNGKRGTTVLMADGSVRFLSESTSDEVFQAMCTIRGGEAKLNLDRAAPKLELPEPEDDQPDAKVPDKPVSAAKDPGKPPEPVQDKKPKKP